MDFERSKGWKKLAEPILQAAKDLDVKVVQVKEKFGGLRIHLNGGPQWLQDMAYRMEELSYHTCEYCGKEGKPRNGNWIKTLCEECYAK